MRIAEALAHSGACERPTADCPETWMSGVWWALRSAIGPRVSQLVDSQQQAAGHRLDRNASPLEAKADRTGEASP